MEDRGANKCFQIVIKVGKSSRLDALTFLASSLPCPWCSVIGVAFHFLSCSNCQVTPREGRPTDLPYNRSLRSSQLDPAAWARLSLILHVLDCITWTNQLMRECQLWPLSGFEKSIMRRRPVRQIIKLRANIQSPYLVQETLVRFIVSLLCSVLPPSTESSAKLVLTSRKLRKDSRSMSDIIGVQQQYPISQGRGIRSM